MDSNPAGTIWNYSSVPAYAPDGSLLSASHGRRSSIYRAQNSTLFNAFEEDGVALSQLDEEEESEDEPANANTAGQGLGQAKRPSVIDVERGISGGGDMASPVRGGRSLVGKNGRSDVPGGRHPAYQDR